MSKQAWVDLTDMLAWSGHYTGIQRVTYEYAKRYESEGAKFFAYDSQDERFFELSFSEVVSKHKNPDADTIPLNQDKVSLRRQLRQVIGTPYYKLDEQSRAFFQPYVYALNHTFRSTMHFVNTLSGKDRNAAPSEYERYPDAKFEKDDRVILLGAGWNELNILSGLYELKSTIGFKISQHINDMLPVYQPHLFADELPQYFTPFAKLAIKAADTITVISQSTKKDIEIFCKQEGLSTKPEVQVIRLGDNPIDITMPSKPVPGLADEKYILAVGTFEIRKNYQVLYQAIKLAELEQKEMPKIVIAGRKGWLTEDLRHVIERDPHVHKKIIWLKDVDDTELKWLFENCMFSVFPSLAEGWGLPIAESLGYGKMCLASGVSSMLEIGSGLVDYFLPYDARECMEKILYYTSEARYVDKNLLVKNEYVTYSWDESYKNFRIAVDK